MRYLVFNFTVLAALGYLFMASPHQSFANWIGNAPQMFDAARNAGRDHMSGEDPDVTAGRTLLEALEPVVEQALSSSDGADAPSAPAARFSQSISTEEILATEAPADPVTDDARPVTIQDIEGIIRGLLDARIKTGDDQDGSAGVDTPVRLAGDEADTVRPQPERRPVVGPSTGLASGAVAPDQSLLTNAAPNEAAGDSSRVAEVADNVLAARMAVSQEMTDEEIAAAFAQLQQAARADAAASGGTQSAEMAVAAADSQTEGSSSFDRARKSAPVAPASPAFMSPAQRADSLAMMVEELQLMYLERTGG